MIKTITTALLICFAMVSFSQEEETDYIQYMSLYLNPDLENLGQLKENMKAHNQKYHSEDPYSAFVFSVMTGPHSGWWIWVMGPCTMEDLDNREIAEGHDEDWDDNILGLCEERGELEFWRLDADMSNRIELDPPHAASRLRFLTINPNNDHRVNGLLRSVKETILAMPGDVYHAVYENRFIQGQRGRHMMIVSHFKTMSELDSDDQFRMQYEKTNGPNSWGAFLTDWNSTFSDTYDEIATVMTDMNGNTDDEDEE